MLNSEELNHIIPDTYPIRQQNSQLANLTVAQQAIATAASSTSTVATVIINSECLASSNMGTLLFLTLLGIESLVMLQYLNVRYSDSANVVFQEMSVDKFPNFFSAFLKGENFNNTLYEIQEGGFGNQSTSSLFLDASGSDLSVLICWLFVMAICHPIKDLIKEKGSPEIQKFFKRFRNFYN